jgi:hypothetical protein
MTQPIFALPCEYGLTVTKATYGNVAKFATTSGNAVPSGDGQLTAAYEIKTVPIDNEIAIALDRQLTELKGSFFFSQFYFDDQTYKYRIIGDTWNWQVIGPTANIFTLNVERLQDAAVEFPLDYGQTLENGIGSHFFRIATTSGTATPSTTVYQQRRYSVATRTLSKQSAQSLETTLRGLGGSAFYSQVYLDANPRLYKLEENSWQFETQGENAYKATFSLLEVYSNTGGDYPCAIEAATLSRTSYGERIKLAAASGNAVPGTSSIVINGYDIKTLELTDAAANSLETSLANLSGSYFFGKFYYDAVVKKYRVVNDNWQRVVNGKDANIISFSVEEVYEPTVEFAIDYGLTQSQSISSNIIRIATTSGTATPSAQSRSIKEVEVKTRPMSRTSALALEAILQGLQGGSFYSQLYLDTTPRLYRLSPYEWQWSPSDENGYVCEFSMLEVMPDTADIPCREAINIDRTSRIRKAQFGDGYEQVAPDGINTDTVVYTIETLPLSDAQATSLDTTLRNRKGDFFFSKLKDEPAVAKYRLDDNRWSWSIQGKDANVFRFRLRKVYDL